MSQFHDYKAPNFVIFAWADGRPEHVAAAESITVARAAWAAALVQYPHREMTLQQGARVIERRAALPVA